MIMNLFAKLPAVDYTKNTDNGDLHIPIRHVSQQTSESKERTRHIKID